MRRAPALLMLAFCGCDDEPVYGRGPDAGVAPDAAAGDGGGASVPDGATGCSDLADCEGVACAQGDLDLPCAACVGGFCAVCDEAEDCRAASPTWNACTAAGSCVECASGDDCAANPDALGPTCDAERGFCTCAEDGDCAGNPNGAVCVPREGGYCGCADDADCPDGRACEIIGGPDVCVGAR